MANSYKDIIITPNRANTADPKIEFRGGNTTVNTSITLQTYPISNGMLSFEGAAGQLFSITNDLTGSLFSVNDVSGIPSFEVLANGYVMIAPMGGSVVIGNTVFGNTSTSTTGRLVVTSSISPQIEAINAGTGNAYIGANRATAAAGEVGYMFRTAGATNWWNYMPVNSGSMNWYSAGADRMTLSNTGVLSVTGDIRVPITYDSDNTAYYSNPAGISNLNNLVLQGGLASTTNTAAYHDAALEVREFNFGGAQVDTTSISPRIGFHWSGRVASQIGMNSSGHIVILNNPGNDYEVLRSGNFYAPIFYDGNDSAYYCNPNGTSYLATIENNAGAKFVIQNAVDGGNTRGLAMWSGTDNNWAIYMGQSGASKSFNNGTAPASLLGQTAHHIRFRVANNNAQGFLWENGAEVALMSLNGANGDLAIKGNTRSTIFYDIDNTSYYIDAASTSVLNAVNFAGGSKVDTAGDVYARRSSGTTGVYYFVDGGSKYLYWNGSDYVFGGAGNVLAGTSFRAPIFYDSDNTGYYINPASTSVMNDIFAASYRQAPTGAPRVNLGDPTVTEMALFDEQFTNKTWFFPPANVICETSTDGTTWTTYSVSDANKKLLVGGDGGSGLSIPYNTPYFRIRFVNDGNYVYLNALYMYFSSQGHSTKVQMYTKNYGSTTWVQYTNSDVLANAWPGHIYLPFSTIAYHPSTYVDEVAIVFIPTWNPTWSANPIALYKAQLWGGYPAAKRNIFSTDSDKNVVFPSSVSGSVFYDSNNSSYYIDANGTSVLNLLTVSATNDVQLTLSGGGTSWAGLYWVDPDGADTIYYRGSTSTFAIGGGGSVVANKKLHINGGTTIGSGLAATSVATNGLLVQTDVRAPLFYDSDNTSFYIDPASTSVLSALTVGGSPVMRGVGQPPTTNNNNWNTLGDNHNTIYEMLQENFNIGGSGNSNFPSNAVYKYGALINFSSNGSARGQVYISHAGNDLIFRGGWSTGSWQTWNKVLTDQNYTAYAMPAGASATNSVDLRAPIFYDSNDTAYYTNPNSTSNMNAISAINITANTVTIGMPNSSGNAPIKTFSIVTNGQGANNTTYELGRISRDVVNWSTNVLEITVYNLYYRGGMSRWVVSYNQVDAGTVELMAEAGTIAHKLYLGDEVTVAGNVRYRPVLIDLPAYTIANIEMKYKYSEVASISASSQLQFTGTYTTNASASGTASTTTAIIANNSIYWNGIALPAAGTSFGNPNTIGRSDSNGYTFFNYINSNTGNSENPTVSQIIVTNGTDNYYRKASVAHLKSSLGTIDTANNATYAYGKQESQLSVARLTNLTSTTTTNAGTDNSESCISYLSGISLFGQSDGALYSHVYSASWKHNIYGDYRTGQLAVRGKNNGTWQAWRTVLDSSNYNDYAPTKTGTGASGTWSISVTGNAATAGGLSVHTGTNNEANKIVRTDGNGYIQAGYIHSASGNEANNSNPPRVWGVNGSDSYLRTYLTSALSVGSAATLTTARNINGVSFNGSADITIPTTDSTKLPLAGGTMTGAITFAAGQTWPTFNQNTTGSAATFTSTSQNSQFNSVGVGTAASGTGGEIRATNNITAYYSDDRLKNRIGNIDNALDKIMSLNGFYYEANEIAQEFGYKKQKEVGVSAQEVQKILPEIVVPAPIDENYLTVRYEKMIPLLIEAIKEQQAYINRLEEKIDSIVQKLEDK